MPDDTKQETRVTIDAPVIPQEVVEFAEAFAKLAEDSGLVGASCDIEVHTPGLTRCELRILFRQVDGRGRPFRRLAIEATGKTTMQLQWDDESVS